MRTRTTLTAAALLGGSALLGWADHLLLERGSAYLRIWR
jgi:hypothetical protein